MITSNPHSCACRNCGRTIPAHSQIVMTNRGPFHIGCASPQDLESTEIELQFGGKLVGSEERAGIQYRFAGPDRRYRSAHFFIPFSDIMQTAEAVRFNWSEYEELRSKTKLGDTIEKRGRLGMTIRVSLLEPGVWLFKRHIGVCNSDQVAQYSAELESAFERLSESLLIGTVSGAQS